MTIMKFCNAVSHLTNEDYNELQMPHWFRCLRVSRHGISERHDVCSVVCVCVCVWCVCVVCVCVCGVCVCVGDARYAVKSIRAVVYQFFYMNSDHL